MAGELEKAEQEIWGGIGYVGGHHSGTTPGVIKATDILLSGGSLNEALEEVRSTQIEHAQAGQEFGRGNAKELTKAVTFAAAIGRLLSGLG